MDLAMLKSKRLEIAATALWIIISGGFAVFRTFSIDPFGIDSDRCVVSYFHNRAGISKG